MGGGGERVRVGVEMQRGQGIGAARVVHGRGAAAQSIKGGRGGGGGSRGTGGEARGDARRWGAVAKLAGSTGPGEAVRCGREVESSGRGAGSLCRDATLPQACGRLR